MHLKTNTDYISLVKEFTLEIVLICVEQKARKQHNRQNNLGNAAGEDHLFIGHD